MFSSSEDERRDKKKTQNKDLSYDDSEDDNNWIEQIIRSTARVDGEYSKDRCDAQISLRFEVEQLSKGLRDGIYKMHRNFQKTEKMTYLSYNDSKAIADALNFWPLLPTSETMMVIEPNGTTRGFGLRGFKASYVPWSVFSSPDILSRRVMVNTQMMLIRWAVSVLVLDLRFYLQVKKIESEAVEKGFITKEGFYRNDPVVTVEQGTMIIGLIPEIFRPLISLFGLNIVVEAFDSYNLDMSARVMPDECLVEKMEDGDFDEISYKVMTTSEVETKTGGMNPCVLLVSQVIRAVLQVSKKNLKAGNRVVKFHLASTVKDLTGLNFFLNAEATEIIKYESYAPVSALIRSVKKEEKLVSVSQARVSKDLGGLRASKLQQVFLTSDRVGQILPLPNLKIPCKFKEKTTWTRERLSMISSYIRQFNADNYRVKWLLLNKHLYIQGWWNMEIGLKWLREKPFEVTSMTQIRGWFDMPPFNSTWKLSRSHNAIIMTCEDPDLAETQLTDFFDLLLKGERLKKI
jgi:hypothetical protein